MAVELTVELVLSGVDPAKTNLEALSAFAERENLIVPESKTKAEIIADFVVQINERGAPEPPDAGDDTPPEEPPDAGDDESDEDDVDLPPALKRRGVPKKTVFSAKEVKIVDDAPNALKRRLGRK